MAKCQRILTCCIVVFLAACGTTDAPRGQVDPTPTMPEPSNLEAHWIDVGRITLTWQQQHEGDVCISKLHSPMYGYVFYGCSWYQPGLNRVEIGGPAMTDAQQPVVGELYYLHQGGKNFVEVELGSLRTLFLPLVRS